MKDTAMNKGFNLVALRDFIVRFAEVLSSSVRSEEVFGAGSELLRQLVVHDDWLPDRFARPHPTEHRQYLLHCDSQERFCVVSTVWGPGQSTPIHNHTTWGLVGVLRGAEICQRYTRGPGGLCADGASRKMVAGDVEILSIDRGDIHKVANASDVCASVSIHVYGGNIGAINRSIFDDAGNLRPFTSGYADELLPNLWQAV